MRGFNRGSVHICDVLNRGKLKTTAESVSATSAIKGKANSYSEQTFAQQIPL